VEVGSPKVGFVLRFSSAEVGSVEGRLSEVGSVEVGSAEGRPR